MSVASVLRILQAAALLLAVILLIATFNVRVPATRHLVPGVAWILLSLVPGLERARYNARRRKGGEPRIPELLYITLIKDCEPTHLMGLQVIFASAGLLYIHEAIGELSLLGFP